MDIIKIINEVIQQRNDDELDNDITRKVLKYKFDDELELTKPMIINQNKAEYELLNFLISIGLYEDPHFNINYSKDNNFEPTFTDRLGSIIITDFIPEFRKYVRKKYGYEDQYWDDAFNLLKNNIIKILSKYGLELSDINPFLYKYGDMLISLKTPDNIEYAHKFQRYVLSNPHKLITTKEFLGDNSEERKEKRKFMKYNVGGYEYKFLLNPSKDDMYYGTGNQSIFGGIFGKMIDSFAGVNKVEYEKVILQILYDFNPINFIIGGDGFYLLSDVEKFKEDENFNIKPIGVNDNILYKKLVDLKALYEKLNSDKIKMIVFLNLGGNLTTVKNGGVVDRQNKKIYYPYILT